MVFAGTKRFELRRQLGSGGMGVVYEAVDHARGMRVALKTLRRLDANGLLRFKREFRALIDLSHPNIVRLYELVSEGRDWFFTMELIDGQDLVSYVRMDAPALQPPILPDRGTSPSAIALAATVIPDSPTPGGEMTAPGDGGVPAAAGSPGPAPAGTEEEQPGPPGPPRDEDRLPLEDRIDHARLEDSLGQLAGALHALHEAGMVHCDVKPSNVLVTGQGRVALMDFGVVSLARGASGWSHGLVHASQAQGTPAFMAPEQARGEAPGAAADWYAFGVTLYLLLAGRLPFDSHPVQILLDKQERDPLPPGRFTRGIPPALEDLCLRLLSRAPAARPGGEEVQAALGVPLARSGQSRRARMALVDGEDFVGRRAELAALHECYQAARAGDMRCVVVGGPSGMGKTSLLLRFLSESRDAAAVPLVLMGRCRERESLTYKAFDGLIDQLSLHLQDMPAQARRALLPPGAALLARLFPVLRRVEELDTSMPIAGGMELRLQAVHTLRALLGALARERPVVACIDDLQWADRDSLDLLHGLLEPPAPAGLLLLATLRADSLQPGEDAALARLLAGLDSNPACRRITLAPLAADEQAALVTRLGARRDGAGARVPADQELLREAGGHPMLLTELLRFAEEAPEELARAGMLGLEDVLVRRVARLPAIARDLIDVVAVAGEPMPLGVLAAAVDLAPDSREQAFAQAGAVRLLRTTRAGPEPWLDVYHAKVREAVLERMNAEHVRALHGRIAQAMEAWQGAPVASLARHWLAAGAQDRAIAYLLRTAQAAAEQLALARATALFRTAAALLEEAPQDGASDRLRCQTWLGLAQGLRLVDGIDEALRLLARAQAVARGHGWHEALADIHHLRGNLLFTRNDLDGCLDQHARACARARQIRSETGSVRRIAAALGGLGDAYSMRGQFEMACEHYTRCIDLCRQHGYGDIEAAHLPMRGMMRTYRKDFRGALLDGIAAMALATRIGHPRAEVVAITTCLGRVWMELGWLDSARPHLERARVLARNMGSPRFEAMALTILARLLAMRGAGEQAEAVAAEARAMLRESARSIGDVFVLSGCARVTRDRASREDILAEAEALVEAGTLLDVSLLFYRDATEIALAGGDHARVERYARMLEDLTRAEPAPWIRFLIERARALVAYRQGRRDGEIVETLRRLLGEAWQAGFQATAEALGEALASAATDASAAALRTQTPPRRP